MRSAEASVANVTHFSLPTPSPVSCAPHRCCSQDSSPVNFLHANLHIRVCFKESWPMTLGTRNSARKQFPKWDFESRSPASFLAIKPPSLVVDGVLITLACSCKAVVKIFTCIELEWDIGGREWTAGCNISSFWEVHIVVIRTMELNSSF